MIISRLIMSFAALIWMIGAGGFSAIYAQAPVVAVLNFNNASGKFYLDDLKQSFPALLKTELSQKKSITIVERQKIDAILKEQDFSMSDLSEDKDKQAKVGQLLGADFIITGDITESDGKLRIDVALTQTATGKVVGEKALAPSKSYINAMAELLANNLAYDLTGQGQKIQKMKTKGAPTMTLLGTTVALGALTAISYKQKTKYYDDYKDNADLGKMSHLYKKANNWNKAAGVFTGLTVISLGAYVYAVIKNHTTDREVLATGNRETKFAMAPFYYRQPSAVTGLNFTIRF